MFSALVWGVAVALCWLLKLTLHVPPIVHLAIGLAVCGPAALIYLRTPALSQSDRAILANVLRGREARLLKLLGIVREQR